MIWVLEDTFQVIERNTKQMWVVETHYWEPDKAYKVVTMTEARSGATAQRFTEGRAGKRAALDMCTMLGGHRYRNQWVLECTREVAGWTTEVFTPIIGCVKRVCDVGEGGRWVH